MRRGFTLLELVVVLTVLVALAGVVVLLADNTTNRAAKQATLTTMTTIRDASATFQTQMGNLPNTLRDLYIQPTGAAAYDPYMRRGWNGPYLQGAGTPYVVNAASGFSADYGAAGDPAPVDGWNRPMVLQYPNAAATIDPNQRLLFARLVSAGPDGIIQTPESVLYPTPQQRGDDLVVFLQRPDVAP
jgi:prepilin-type N-terminal cleavage/methylation domain-containing protein